MSDSDDLEEKLTAKIEKVKFKMQKARARGDAEKVATYKGKIAHWQDQLRESLGSEGGLPPGWEQKVTDDGRTYYVDTIGETVSWDLPGCEPPPPAAVEASGRRRSLLIGINYPGSSAELRGCINDVKRMKSYITGCGFPDDADSMRV